MHFSPAPVIPRSILESGIMSSQRRTESARANGVRSHGPVTESGKQISSQNALRHTLLARCVVVEGESTEGFEETLTEHLDRFQPADGVEFGIVEEMVAAWWRMRHQRLGHRNPSAARLRRRPAPVRRNGPLGRRLRPPRVVRPAYAADAVWPRAICFPRAAAMTSLGRTVAPSRRMALFSPRLIKQKTA